MPAARWIVRLALVACLSPAASMAAGPEQAPAGALACSGCHPAGKGVDSPVPRLAGRPAGEIATAMRDFRSAARPATVMGRIAKGFTDPEIDAIAAWVGRQKE